MERPSKAVIKEPGPDPEELLRWGRGSGDVEDSGMAPSGPRGPGRDDDTKVLA